MPLTPQELIRNLGDLPPLPQVAARVLRISADSDASARDLQKVISTDQALSAQILKISNSAMFGMVREVTTLTQAIMTLGFSTTRSVVVASSVKNLYSRGIVGQHERLMWQHSLVAALASSAYGRVLRFPRADEAFLAGLMHDIGKSVLVTKLPETYLTLVRRIQEGEGDGLSLELDTFGFDHAMVGEALLRAWNISEGIQQAARWHHDPGQADPAHATLVALVALGNHMAVGLEAGLERAEALVPATLEARRILGLDPETHAAHEASVLEALEKDKALLTEF